MNYAEDLITEILSSQPGITQEQIEKAIEEQSEKGGRLADNIAALGYMAEIDVLRAIGEKLNIPFLPSIKDASCSSNSSSFDFLLEV